MSSWFFDDPAGVIIPKLSSTPTMNSGMPVTSDGVYRYLLNYAPKSPADGNHYAFKNGDWVAFDPGTAWGEISGTLSDQTDLQAALDAKANLHGNVNEWFNASEFKIGTNVYLKKNGNDFEMWHENAGGFKCTTGGYIYANEFYRNSSREFKYDFTDVAENATEILLSTKILNYKLKANDQPAIGFIAEDTNPILSGEIRKGTISVTIWLYLPRHFRKL
jgi:hypothetical protein